MSDIDVNINEPAQPTEPAESEQPETDTGTDAPETSEKDADSED